MHAQAVGVSAGEAVHVEEVAGLPTPLFNQSPTLFIVSEGRSQQALKEAVLQQEARGSALGVGPQLRRQGIHKVDSRARRVGGAADWVVGGRPGARLGMGKGHEALESSRAPHPTTLSLSQGGQRVAEQAPELGQRVVVAAGDRSRRHQPAALPVAPPPCQAYGGG